MVSESLRSVKAVIFDLDETLIDAPKGLEAAHRSVINRICEPDSCKEMAYSREELVEKLSDFDDRMNSEKIYDRDKWWPEFIEEVGLGVEFSESLVKELTQLYWKTYAENAKPYPDSESVLASLKEKGYPLGMITDTDGPGVSKKDRVSNLQLSELFDVIVIGGDDTKDSKPSPAPFKLVASELGVDPKECVMVGDKPFTDIEGANSVGMKTILIKRRDWSGGKKPDFQVDSLKEIQELL